MKTNIKSLFLFALSLGTMTSCSDFLTEDSKMGLTEEQIYSDLSYIETNLTGIYNNMRDWTRADERAWFLMTGTDEIQRGALQMKDGGENASLDNYDANLNSMTNRVKDQWNARYPVVAAAAKIIRALDNDQVVAATKAAHLLGEACFIRGFMDLELATYWGEIPLIDLNKVGETGYGRQSLTDTWRFVISDLEKAAKYAPESNDPGRATSGAGYALLGKAYMAAPVETGLRDFAKAAECFEKVMSMGYSLVNYADLFDYRTPNTEESIFELQFNNNPNQNKIQFQIGSRVAQNWWSDGCYFAGYDHVVVTEYAYSDVADGGVWEEGDLRREEAIRYDFTYYGETPNLDCVSWEDLGDDYDELKPHIKKYEDFRTDQHSDAGLNNMWNSGKNIPVLRYADVLLCYAECLNELNRTSEG
ncbi:MAG: RagB/SusD family nutrient uptake outer membrane protein, partial [Muribaculaceae bacterium]|nr:RagB/SusD family nutrient uptake outer membrane protein [Muribaculaceae bacterium]